MNCQHPPNLVLTILDDETSMVQWCKDCGSVRYVIKGTDKRFGEVDKSVPNHYLPWDSPNHTSTHHQLGLTEEERELFLSDEPYEKKYKRKNNV